MYVCKPPKTKACRGIDRVGRVHTGTDVATGDDVETSMLDEACLSGCIDVHLVLVLVRVPSVSDCYGEKRVEKDVDA